jgi:hypothetical protein
MNTTTKGNQMSRLAKDNPELNEQELNDLAWRGGRKVFNSKNELRFEYTCPKCFDEYWVNEETHDWIQTLERLPKCTPCYL